MATIAVNPISVLAFASTPLNGQGIRGFIPQTLQTTDNYARQAGIRFQLRNAWNTSYTKQLQGKKMIISPFRAVNNAGDLLSRQNYSCGGPCQTPQSIAGLHGLRQRFGHIQNMCDGSGVPPAACNTKFVYDSSDYTRYLLQRAINVNYNDLSYGGDQSNGSQSAITAIRRY